MERQVHAFKFEDQIKIDLDVVEEEKGYIDEWDIGTNVSVKFIKEKGPIAGSDILRMLKHLDTVIETGDSFFMILGRHINKKCSAVYELEFTPEICKALKGQLTTELIKEFADQVKHDFKGPENEKACQLFHKQWKEEHKHLMGKLTVNPKVNSTNRRVQCSINMRNYNSLFGNIEPSDKFQHLVGVDFA